MPLIYDPDHAFNDPLHPFYKPAILFAPKRLTTSNTDPSPQDSDFSDSAVAARTAGMLDIAELADREYEQARIDQAALEHFRHIGKVPRMPKP